MKGEKRICIRVALLSTALIIQTCFSQNAKTQRNLDQIFRSADSLLSKTKFKSDTPDSNMISQLEKRRSEIEAELNGYRSLKGITAERWSLIAGDRLAKLEMSRMACKAEKKLPRKTEDGSLKIAQKIKGQSIAKKGGTQIKSEEKYSLYTIWLKNYLLDSKNQSAFTENPSRQQLIDQRDFIGKLDTCLKFLCSDLSYLQRADTLLLQLFFIKQLPPDFFRNRGQIDVMIAALLALPDSMRTIDSFVRLVKRDSDPHRAVYLAGQLMYEQDRNTLQNHFRRIMAQYEKDPENYLTFIEMLLNWPDDKRQDRIISPLLRLANRTRDAGVLSDVFMELDAQLPDSMSKSDTEKTLRLIEDGLFGGDNRRYVRSERLQNLVVRADSILNGSDNKKMIVVLPFYRVGDLNTRLESGHVIAMRESLKAALSKNYSVQTYDAPDTLSQFIIESMRNTEPGDHMPWRGIKSRTGLYAVSTFEYAEENKPINLNVLFFDGQDDLMLAGFDESIPFDRDLNAFGKNAYDSFSRMETGLSGVLTAYLNFKNIKPAGLTDFFDMQKLKAYLYLKSYFDVNPSSEFDETLWTGITSVFFDEFDKSDHWGIIAPIEELLKSQIAARNGWTPVSSKEAERERRLLTISGEGRKNDASTYDICLSVNREQTLTIGLNFQGPFHGGRLSGLQVESSARFIMRTIENYLRSNREAVVRPAPSEKPRLAYALPSLFMAGSSQFLSAHHRESSWKNWRFWLGTALAAGQITALGKAAAYDHDAVRGVNDRDAANARLDKRNDCLYTAAGIALSSALISVLDVLFFKRK